LFQCVAGEDAEGVRDAGFLGGLSDAAGDFVDDDVVVGGVAAEEASDAEDRVVIFCLG